MKLFIQKLPVTSTTSFVAKTFCTPEFEVGWHQHIEYELILFTKGSGLSFIGNHVGKFETGDIYFLGSNLPHTFQKKEPDVITSAIVIQFREDFWGKGFLHLPECLPIRQLFRESAYGLKINGQSKGLLQQLIIALEQRNDFRRLLILGECLELMATKKQYYPVSTQNIKQQPGKGNEPIDKVFQFTIDSFKEPILLSQAAAIACMSVPAFCNYFKRSTKKTYIGFLNEVRIGFACSLLIETNTSILDICYQSGYNTMANFHQHFLKIKKITPLQYRKHFTNSIIKEETG